MRTQDRIENAISRIKIEITEQRLKEIQYKTRGDEYMLRLTYMQISELYGKLNALKWVLGEC